MNAGVFAFPINKTSTVSRSSGIASAALGALAAGLLVILVGALARIPLAKVPENTLKFVVGIMLTTFGTFWLGEGFGVAWPLADVFLLILAAIYNFIVGDMVILIGVALAVTILALINNVGALAPLRGFSGPFLVIAVLASLVATLSREGFPSTVSG